MLSTFPTFPPLLPEVPPYPTFRPLPLTTTLQPQVFALGGDPLFGQIVKAGEPVLSAAVGKIYNKYVMLLLTTPTQHPTHARPRCLALASPNPNLPFNAPAAASPHPARPSQVHLVG